MSPYLSPLTQGANCALLLSGTPALSRPIELFTQITALDKSFKISLVDFGLRYCNGVKVGEVLWRVWSSKLVIWVASICSLRIQLLSALEPRFFLTPLMYTYLRNYKLSYFVRDLMVLASIYRTTLDGTLVELPICMSCRCTWKTASWSGWSMRAKYYTLDCVMYPELTGCYYWFRSSIVLVQIPHLPPIVCVCAMFVSRRLKSEVLDQLPSKRRQMVCHLCYCVGRAHCTVCASRWHVLTYAGPSWSIHDKGKEQRVERNETRAGQSWETQGLTEPTQWAKRVDQEHHCMHVDHAYL